ncbi:MAG: hypothetical protein U0231_15790 [Nitrospiraceae bacterium]
MSIWKWPNTQFMVLVLSGDGNKAKAMHETTLLPLMESIVGIRGCDDHDDGAKTKRVESEAVRAAKDRVRFLLIIACGAVILVFTVGFIIVAAIVRPLGMLANTDIMLASSWDLTLRAPSQRRG